MLDMHGFQVSRCDGNPVDLWNRMSQAQPEDDPVLEDFLQLIAPWMMPIMMTLFLLSLTATYRGAGINGYICQLLRHLPDADAMMDYVAYLYDRSFEAGAGLTVEASRWDTRSPQRTSGIASRRSTTAWRRW